MAQGRRPDNRRPNNGNQKKGSSGKKMPSGAPMSSPNAINRNEPGRQNMQQGKPSSINSNNKVQRGQNASRKAQGQNIAKGQNNAIRPNQKALQNQPDKLNAKNRRRAKASAKGMPASGQMPKTAGNPKQIKEITEQGAQVQQQENMIRPLFGDEVPASPKINEVKSNESSSKKESLSFFERKRLEKQRKKEEKEAQKPVSVLDEIMQDPIEERRKHAARQRKREALTAAFNCLLCVVILIGVLIIAVLYVVDYVAAKPSFAFATEGTIEHTIGATALIARNETVIDSNHTGSILTQATEGSRVAKGQLLAMVIPNGMESTVNDLRNVEQQIVERERELMAQGKGFGAKSIFSDVNNDILPIITMVRSDALLGNLSNMTSYSSSIRVLMEKRDLDMENIDFEDEQLKVLRNSESTLRNQLETQASSIYALIPGIVSYKLDGHEKDVTYTRLMGMMDYECEDLIKQCSNIITDDLNAKASEPVLRIVQNDVQYFACLLDGGSITEFAVDSLHVIRIPSEGISISDCKVVRSNLTEDGLLVVFETSNQVERLLDRRTVNIEIVQTKQSGVRVPVSALVDADYDRSIATIYVNESGYARGYTVKIVDYDREYAIVEPIDENSNIPNVSTIVITNPHTVKEGDKVEK